MFETGPRGGAGLGSNHLCCEEGWYFDLVGVTICSKGIQQGEPRGTRTSYATRKVGISILLV